MRTSKLFAAVLAAIVSTGCYHAVIETGRPASGEMIHQPWAMSFAWGLVPPPVVETASKCPNGVARVETQWSFLNGLVNAVTFGIVTPMDIMVSCASRGSAMAAIPASAFETPARAIEVAADAAVKSGHEIYIQF
jgi:Bor protein